MAYKKTIPLTEKSVTVLSREASAFLKKRKYRQAIEAYKTLLKKEQKPRWLSQLLEAYLGRIGELAQKNMFKEALVIHQNMAAACKVEIDPELQALLFCACQDYEQTLAILKSDVHLDVQFRERLKSIIASRISLIPGDRLQNLPTHQELLSHRQIIWDALKALDSGDDDACITRIGEITFRSHYMDFRLFIKGLYSYYHNDFSDTLACFDKIPTTSVLKRLAQTTEKHLNGTLFPDSQKMLQPIALPEMEFILALTGKNISVDIFSQLQTEAFTNFFKDKFFNLVRSYQNLFEPALLRAICLKALIMDSSCIKDFRLILGSLSNFEISRLHALNFERMKIFDLANSEWAECFELIDKGPFKTQSEKNLARAVLLRKIAQNKQYLEENEDDDDDDDEWVDLDNDDYDEEEEDDLSHSPWQSDYALSLLYDPADKTTYQKLMNYYKSAQDKAGYQYWLEKYLEQFPNDVDSLFEAASQAFQKRTYKSAIGYIDQILKLDSLNKKAKDFKVFLHVSKARKHIAEKKYHLARQEFQHATKVYAEIQVNGSLYVKWGLFELLAGDDSAGSSLLQKGVQIIGAGIKGLLIPYIEAKRMNLPKRFIQRYSVPLFNKLNEPASVQNALDLIDTIIEYRSIDFNAKSQDIFYFIEYLKKAILCDYDTSGMSKICDFLLNNRQFELAQKYATRGVKKYPGQPLLVFYLMMAKSTNNLYKLSRPDLKKLSGAALLAEKIGDMKTARLIRNALVIQNGSFLPRGRTPFPPMLDEAMEDILENINPELLSEVMDNILNEIIPGRSEKKKREAKKSSDNDTDPPQPKNDPDQLTLF